MYKEAQRIDNILNYCPHGIALIIVKLSTDLDCVLFLFLQVLDVPDLSYSYVDPVTGY